MPLPQMLLNRNNCIPILLKSFTSNAVVKALIFSPGVTDEFYLFNRDAVPLNLQVSNLWDAIVTLTNRTSIRASFTGAFLLLHLDSEQFAQVLEAEPETRPNASKNGTRVLWNDQPWDATQPQLHKALGVQIHPMPGSETARHFYRVNVSGWNLSGSELLRAAALGTGTTFRTESDRIFFEKRALR